MNPRENIMIIACAVLLVTPCVLAEPNVPGFVVETYRNLPGSPQRLSFDYDDLSGTLYVGKALHSPVYPAFKISPGDCPSEIGDTPLPDPDTVLYDRGGVIAPEPGSLLVGGQPGYIAAILPDGSTMTIFSGLSNPNAMAFDRDGCLLFIDTYPSSPGPVFRACGGDPTELHELFTPEDEATHIAVHHSGWIVLGTREGGAGGICAYKDGNLIELVDNLELSALTCVPITFGRSGRWGPDKLLALCGSDLRSYEFDFSANPPELVAWQTIGTGFDANYTDIASGPHGFIYISEQEFGGQGVNRILRLTPKPTPPGDINGDGYVDFDDIDPFVAILGGG